MDVLGTNEPEIVGVETLCLGPPEAHEWEQIFLFALLYEFISYAQAS
jgi:hypothetical protein